MRARSAESQAREVESEAKGIGLYLLDCVPHSVQSSLVPAGTAQCTGRQQWVFIAVSLPR